MVQHNPFSARYETFNGRDEPYSLRELAASVELLRIVPRHNVEIRTDGRNVETFDRLRYWAYAAIAGTPLRATAVLGAIVRTGYLGGTVAAHARHLDPLFSHDLFGVYLGISAWGGLWLRNERVRALIPLRRRASSR